MPQTFSRLQNSLLEDVTQRLLPAVRRADAPRIILTEPPLRVPNEMVVIPCKVRPLTESGRGISGAASKRWPQHGLITTSIPIIGFVLEGEVDYAVGVTQRMVKEWRQANGAPFHASQMRGRYVLQLPARTFFIVPPRVPHAGGLAHWERRDFNGARSRIFWMNIHPNSVICHTCATEGLNHIHNPFLYLPDPHISWLNDLLIEELRSSGENYMAIAQAYLLAVLLRVERHLKGQPLAASPPEEEELDEVSSKSNDLTTMTLHRARRYIEAHLDRPLSPASIARHAYVSPSHLNRLFRREQSTSLMGFVTQRRAEAARSLLLTTDLPIIDVARRVGFGRPSHFSHAFYRWTGCSPLQFRQSRRGSIDLETSRQSRTSRKMQR